MEDCCQQILGLTNVEDPSLLEDEAKHILQFQHTSVGKKNNANYACSNFI